MLSHCGHRSRATGGYEGLRRLRSKSEKLEKFLTLNLKRSLAVGGFAYGIRRYFKIFDDFLKLSAENYLSDWV